MGEGGDAVVGTGGNQYGRGKGGDGGGRSGWDGIVKDRDKMEDSLSGSTVEGKT